MANRSVKNKSIEPSVESSPGIRIFLNGSEVRCSPDDYIIDIAWREGIRIPNLCLHERLERTANCRLCVVEVEQNG